MLYFQRQLRQNQLFIEHLGEVLLFEDFAAVCHYVADFCEPEFVAELLANEL